ncbi:MAG TPA: hypothetical protein VG937_36655 [Polyangiaceae bacterium]|nr:hypothetical protein [Polyangiaceae bacterium]
MTEQATDGFARQLSRWASRVRLRRLSASVLSGFAGGAFATCALTALLWRLRLDPRWSASLSLLLGASIGAGLGFRRRWGAREVALFLDARLKTAEAVTSAYFAPSDEAGPGASAKARAESLLASANPKDLRLPVFSRWHALALPAILVSVWLVRLPFPPAPPVAKAPRGSELLRRGAVPGLERIEALEGAPTLSAGDATRLKQLAEEARKLRADLARGLEKREAQARMATLRDGVSAERQRFADKNERAGLESALATLEGERVTERAGKALGDGDIVAFDEEMQRLANQAEAGARDTARKTLEEAARAARAKGAQKLADLLDRQRGTFAQREAKMRALRELGKALEGKLSEDARRDLADLNQSGNPEAARRLSEALAEALNGLSEEERQKLAEALKKRMGGESGELSALSSEELSRLARELSSQKGRERLQEMLRELSQSESADAQRDKALEDAERGGMEAERGLGGAPLPLPGTGPGTGSNGSDRKPGSAGDAKSGADGAPGGPGGGDRGKHEGNSPPLAANELRSRAGARWLPGAPLAGRALGRAPGRAGETANQVGVGNLSTRAGGEVGAVEGADIPEEYRAHVGRYFEP